MTVEEFNRLEESQKKFLLCDAEKVAERKDGFFKYELFEIDGFFIEVRFSYIHRFKRYISAFDLRELPSMYAGKVWAYLNLISTYIAGSDKMKTGLKNTV